MHVSHGSTASRESPTATRYNTATTTTNRESLTPAARSLVAGAPEAAALASPPLLLRLPPLKGATTTTHANYEPARQLLRLLRADNRRPHASASSLPLLILNTRSLLKAAARFCKSSSRIALFFVLDLLVDAVFCALYLVETHLAAANKPLVQDARPAWLWIARPRSLFHLAAGLSFTNLLSLALRLTFSDNRSATFFRLNTFLDILISVPFAILTRINNGHRIYVPYFLRALVLVSQLKNVLRLRSYWPAFNFSTYKEKLVVLISSIIVILYLGVCSFHFVESEFSDYNGTKSVAIPGPDISLMDTFYFIVITISTVGYGDITPTTIAGQAVVIIMIFVAITFLPGLISDVQETFRLQQSGAGTDARGNRDFVVVCGSFNTVSRVQSVLNAIFYRDLTSKTKVVFLARSKPNMATKALLNQSLFKSRVIYLQGTGLDLEDLARVDLRHASAAFILADRYATNCKEEDEHNTLRAWAFDDYAPHVPLYVDNLLPSTERLLERTTTASVCLEDLKQMFMAYNCLYSGVGTLMISLLQQTDPLQTDYEDLWRAQYADGIANEIYHADINPVFVGHAFTEISYYLFREFQVILFGLGVRTMGRSDGDMYRVKLNPGPLHMLSQHDRCLYIAQNEEDVAAVRELTREQFEETFEGDGFGKLRPEGVLRSVSSDARISAASSAATADKIYQKNHAPPLITINTSAELASTMSTPAGGLIGGTLSSPDVHGTHTQSHDAMHSTAAQSIVDMGGDGLATSDIQNGIFNNNATMKDIDTTRNSLTTERIQKRILEYDSLASIYVQDYPTPPCRDDRTPLCWLLPTPNTLSRVTLSDASTVNNHILVCTNSFDLFRFVCTLRSANLTSKELKPILILAPCKPTDDEYGSFASFPELYFMVGDARIQRDLESANIHNADKIVIMNMYKPDAMSSSTGSSNLDDFYDNSAIMVNHMIYNMFHRMGIRKYVVMELKKRSNIKFLRPTGRKQQRPRGGRSGLALAALRHLSQVHRLRHDTVSRSLSHGFDVPSDDRVNHAHNQQIRHHHHDAPAEWSTDVFYAPVFASGRVLSTSMIEPILFQVYHNPFIMEIFNAFCGVQYRDDDVGGYGGGVTGNTSTNMNTDTDTRKKSLHDRSRAGLCYMSVPHVMVGRSFGELYLYLSQSIGVIPIGIFRSGDIGSDVTTTTTTITMMRGGQLHDMSLPQLGNKLPFVICNPLFGYVMMCHDLVYVLATPLQLE